MLSLKKKERYFWKERKAREETLLTHDINFSMRHKLIFIYKRVYIPTRLRAKPSNFLDPTRSIYATSIARHARTSQFSTGKTFWQFTSLSLSLSCQTFWKEIVHIEGNNDEDERVGGDHIHLEI